jgi:hypothetical protein
LRVRGPSAQAARQVEKEVSGLIYLRSGSSGQMQGMNFYSKGCLQDCLEDSHGAIGIACDRLSAIELFNIVAGSREILCGEGNYRFKSL